MPFRRSLKTLLENSYSKKSEILFLFFIFVLSLLIRVIGLRFGEPLLTYWNELNILDPVFEMTKNRTLNPNNFKRPDQILYFLNFVYLNIISFLKTGHSFAASYQTDQYSYFVYSRVMIAVFGSMIPLVAYKIGKESTINFAVPSALLFAFFPLYTLYSHYIAPDVPITLFTLVIILFSIRYMRSREIKNLYLATVFSAINTAEKYPGLISFGIVVFAVIFVQVTLHKSKPGNIVRNSFIESLKFFGVFILSLFIFAPNLFFHIGNVIKELRLEARSSHLGADGLDWFGNMGFYLTKYLEFSNVIVILFILAGTIGIVRKKQYELLPCFYGLIYWICISVLKLHWERWALPMYTFPLLVAAFGCGYLFHVFHKKNSIKLAAGILFGMTIMWSLLNSLSISIRMAHTDTRVAALNYFNEVGITAENSLFEGYTPFTPGGPGNFSFSQMNSNHKYIVLSSYMYDRIYDEPLRYHDEIQKYETVKKKFPLVVQFSPSMPVSSIGIISWADDIKYYLNKILWNGAAERFSGPTIQIYLID